MNLSEARGHYYFFSGKLSDVNRQLCFAGIAVVWIFAIKDSTGHITLPGELTRPLYCFVLGLSFDLVHYAISALSWGVLQRCKEVEGTSETADFLAPAYVNRIPILMVFLKVLSNMAGYVLMIIYMSKTVFS
jgi:hypothetical protein